MQADSARRLYVPLALAVGGTLFAVLAVLDKVYGLVQQPLYLATFAYACLFILIAWAFRRGIPLKPSRLVRPSIYAFVLILNVLTAAYVFAWRISADPTPVLLQTRLAEGDALMEKGKTDDAHLLYRDAYRRYPDSFPVLMRMGALNYQLGDYDKARRYYSRAIEVAPPDSRWRALNDLGQTYWKLQRPEEAIEFYERARQAGIPAAERVEWHYRLGWAYFDAKNYEEAIEHYLEVARAGEKYAAASYYNSACALSQMLTRTSDPEERGELVSAAVQTLRDAWSATTTAEERQALRAGLLGGEGGPDPELQPLRGTPELQAFLRELRKQ